MSYVQEWLGSFDVRNQKAAWSVDWKVEIANQDMTSEMLPYLLEVSTTDKAGLSSDACSLSFDDRNGQIKLPSMSDPVEVRINGVVAFWGFVSGAASRGSRSGGRVLTMQAKGMDTRGKAKAAQRFHMDDATLAEFLQSMAGKSGLDLAVHEDLARIKRDYWIANGESFLSKAQSLAKELGATFKVKGKQAILMPRGLDLGLPVITGQIGKNLMGWNIQPDLGRDRFESVTYEYLDRESGRHKELKTELLQGASKSEAAQPVRVKAKNKAHAEEMAKGRKADGERKGAKGTVDLLITPQAQAEAIFVLKGARPGIDGKYKIDTVSSKANRGGGSGTSLQIEQPQDGAGVDDR